MPFQKGQSGNPSGRPKRAWSWAKLLEEVGEEVEEKTGKKFKELVAKRLWIECVNGNVLAIKELFNRLDGLPQAFVDLTNAGEKFEFNLDEIIGLSNTTAKTANGAKDSTKS